MILARNESCDESFKFNVRAYGVKLDIAEQISKINMWAPLNFSGQIDLKNPLKTFLISEDYGAEQVALRTCNPPPIRVYFSLFLGRGGRDAIALYDLKKRVYIGTTSMDSELSLISANMAHAAASRLVLDPFVGTGSFMVAAAHFGASVIGSDIDGRQIRGKKGGVELNMDQYGFQAQMLGNVICDLAHHGWKSIPLFDAIICDPPYGVRAGAKTIANGTPAFTTKKDGSARYPETRPYELTELIPDLIEFSIRHLVMGGRLAFWLPTTSAYSRTDISHPCMKIIADPEQAFSKWSRRLITMEKIADAGDAKFARAAQTGHGNFKEAYWKPST